MILRLTSSTLKLLPLLPLNEFARIGLLIAIIIKHNNIRDIVLSVSIYAIRNDRLSRFFDFLSLSISRSRITNDDDESMYV